MELDNNEKRDSLEPPKGDNGPDCTPSKTRDILRSGIFGKNLKYEVERARTLRKTTLKTIESEKTKNVDKSTLSPAGRSTTKCSQQDIVTSEKTEPVCNDETRAQKGCKRISIRKYLELSGRRSNTPIIGKYIVALSTTSIILFVFIGELIFNKLTFNGRCLSKVLYPKYDTGHMPYIVSIGYGACEHNLQVDAAERVFFGYGATDQGWPTTLVDKTIKLYSDSSWDSPSVRVYGLLGGLDTNMIRNYGENFRLFWSMFMHGSCIHLLFNVLSQLQILWIIEPDWGFYRTISLFIISGLTGNLSSAVFDPCAVTVGSSGALFGLIAALIPYCIENWSYLASPLFIFIFSLIVSIISLVAFDNNTSVSAHLGGWVAGLLWGLSTLKEDFVISESVIVEYILLSPLCLWALSSERKAEIEERYNLKSKILGKRRRRDLLTKKTTVIKKLYTSSVSFFRRKVSDICLRIIPLMFLVTTVITLSLYLFKESIYSGTYVMSSQARKCQCCYLKKNLNSIEKILSDTTNFYWCFSNYELAKYYCRT